MSIADDVKEIFEKMPEAFLPEKAANLEATIQIELTGEGGGQWAVKIANGQISIDEGQAGSPNMTLSMEASDYVGITRGEVDPMNLFMTGKIKVEGDVMLAMKFQDMFDREQG